MAKRQGMRSTVISVGLVSLALIVSVLWFLGNPGQGHACKCAVPGSPSEELEKFAAVFAGRVVSIEHSFDPDAASVSSEDRTMVGFEVSAVWKGAVHADMYITTPPTGGSCGFAFAEGEGYIVYAHDSNYDDGGYTVGICSRTALLGLAQADLDALGEGRAPQAGTGGPAPEQSQDMALGWTWIIILAVAGAVVVVIGTVVYLRLRRRWATPRAPGNPGPPWAGGRQ